MHNNYKGFTLIECVATLILLGVLATVSVSVTSALRYKAEQSTLIQTDVFYASSCIERIKALNANNEFSSFYKTNKLSCPNASVNISELSATPEYLDSSSNSSAVRIAPVENGQTVRFYLVTVKTGSVEFDYVANVD